MKKLFSTIIILTSLLAPSIVFAHHPLGGMPMETLVDGFLSGIGHPILGFDHLFFVALVGVAALFTSRRQTSSAAYILAMLIGCFVMTVGIELPAKEFVIGLSLLTLGIIVASGRGLSIVPAILIFSGFGFFHGSAFGDAIAQQESIISIQVLSGYLIGLGLIQYAISIFSGWVMSSIFNATTPKCIEARLAGALVLGIGLFLTMEKVEGLTFSLLGLSS